MFDTLLRKLEQLVSPVLSQLGFRLVEREFLNDGGWVLRLYIDRLGNEQYFESSSITIDDCERASRALGDVIEVEGLIPHAYRLEVSSPGVQRPLRYESDFRAYAGSIIRLRTQEQINGRRHYKGLLEGIVDGNIRMRIDDAIYEIPLHQLAKANVEQVPPKQNKMIQ